MKFVPKRLYELAHLLESVRLITFNLKEEAATCGDDSAALTVKEYVQLTDTLLERSVAILNETMEMREHLYNRMNRAGKFDEKEEEDES